MQAHVQPGRTHLHPLLSLHSATIVLAYDKSVVRCEAERVDSTFTRLYSLELLKSPITTTSAAAAAAAAAAGPDDDFTGRRRCHRCVVVLRRKSAVEHRVRVRDEGSGRTGAGADTDADRQAGSHADRQKGRQADKRHTDMRRVTQLDRRACATNGEQRCCCDLRLCVICLYLHVHRAILRPREEEHLAVGVGHGKEAILGICLQANHGQRCGQRCRGNGTVTVWIAPRKRPRFPAQQQRTGHMCVCVCVCV